MIIYGVQKLYRNIDDTVTLFKSEKKAIEFLNEARETYKDKEFVLKKFDFCNGKAFEIEIKLPF